MRARVSQIFIDKYDKAGNRIGKELFLRATGLETTVPINHGDSGSPVVNNKCQVVAINVGGDDRAQSMQYAVDLVELMEILHKVGLKDEEIVATDILPAAGVVIQKLLKQLEDTDLAVCQKGVDALSPVDPIEARRAIPALVRAMQRHDNIEFRRRVAEELERIGPPVKADLDCLTPAFRIPHKQVRTYVLNALAQLGPEAKSAIHILVLALKEKDNELRRKAALVLKDLGAAARPQAFEALLASTNDSDEEVARDAFDALCSLGPLTAEAIGKLIEALGDGKRPIYVRQYAALCLARLESKAAPAVATLVQVLKTEKDTKLLLYSIAALRQIGDKRADVLTILNNMFLSHADELIRAKSLDAIKQLDLSTVSTSTMLKCLANEKNSTIQGDVEKLLDERLEHIDAARIMELKPLLQHKETKYIFQGISTAMRCKGEAEGVANDLASLIEHTDVRVRVKALEALQAIGRNAKAVIPPLLEHLKAGSVDERALVAITLTAIESKDTDLVKVVLPHLVNGLRPLSIPDKGTALRPKIHKALIQIGQPAVDKIVEVFGVISYRGAENIDYRQNLFVALENLGPTCKSEGNYQQVKLLRERELREVEYPLVRKAALRAWRAMEPN